MADFRALCAELVAVENALTGKAQPIANQGQHLDGFSALAHFRSIADRARAALTQPEPQGPSDKELLGWAYYYGIDYVDTNRPSELDGEKAPVRSDELCIFARTVLSRWGCLTSEEILNG